MTGRRNHGLLATALILVPAVVLACTPARTLVELVCIGIIPALMGLLHGFRVAVVAVAWTTALVCACIVASTAPWAACLVMVVVGLGVGASATRGWHTLAAASSSWPAVLLVDPPHLHPWGWAAPPLVTATFAGAAVALSGAWTLLAMHAFVPTLPPLGRPSTVTRRVSLVYAVALAALLGPASFIATSRAAGTTAGWVLLTVLVTARPDSSLTVRRALGRAAGTVLGALAASGVGMVSPLPQITSVIGVIGIAGAVILQLRRSNYALYSFVLTCAIVLVNSSGQGFVHTAEERVVATITGAALSTTLALLIGLAVALRRRVEAGRIPGRPVDVQESTRDTSAGS